MSKSKAKANQGLAKNTETSDAKAKWSLYLILCVLTVSMSSSFTYGFNIGATNLPSHLMHEFFVEAFFPHYELNRSDHDQAYNEFSLESNNYEISNKYLEWLSKKLHAEQPDSRAQAVEDLEKLDSDYLQAYNKTFADHMRATGESLAAKETELKTQGQRLDSIRRKLDAMASFGGTLINAAFVLGGALGAVTSKYMLDWLGRKKSILFHHVFTLAGALCVLAGFYLRKSELVFASRFFYGIQGGMSCSIIPTYLTEISPVGLRGAAGAIQLVFVAHGVAISQLLGFRQLLGTSARWHLLLATPLLPAALGCLLLLVFFAETPSALLIKNNDEPCARFMLGLLHGGSDAQIDEEISRIRRETHEARTSEAVSFRQLLRLKGLRWPLITGIVLQLAQQLCGINAAVFFYSNYIFQNAGVEAELRQYAIFSTGLVFVASSLACVPLVDRLGRRPLLLYPMAVIVLDFVALTVFLHFQETSFIFSYLSFGCIIVFIMAYSVGLGPIPFIYAAECFHLEARSSALAICMLVNWLANLTLTLTFPYLNQLLSKNVFMIFAAFISLALLLIFKIVPETKGLTFDEIIVRFDKNVRKRLINA